MSDPHIVCRIDDGIAVITFDRPEKKNAFTVSMYDALGESLSNADADASVRVIVLTGAGGSFTAGNDIADFLARPPTSADSGSGRFLRAIVGTKKPIIAAVDGVAIGIGCTMLLHVDLVYASTRSKFCMPFVNLGLTPEGASSYLVPRAAGFHRAAELILFGDTFDADTAMRVGIVNRVVEPDALLALVKERAAALAAKPPQALLAAKAMLRASARDAVREALEREGEVFFDRLRSAEAFEAFSAFMEKRKPDFSRTS